MKIRNGFVSNSSSCSFTITNKTSKSLPLAEFVIEASNLVAEYVEEYGSYNFKTPKARRDRAKELLAAMVQEARTMPALQPGDNAVVFGDEQGTEIGAVYDYALRNGGSTKRFGWRLEEFLR